MSAFLIVIVFSVAFLIGYSKRKESLSSPFNHPLLGGAIGFGIRIVPYFVIRVGHLPSLHIEFL
jgi:hypothetical protein